MTFLICTALVLPLHVADEVSACAHVVDNLLDMAHTFNCQPPEGYVNTFDKPSDSFDLAAVIQTLQHHTDVQEPLLSLQ